MSRKLVVVPYEWVKHIIRHPPDVQRRTDESEMVRSLNVKFPDDFGQPAAAKKPSEEEEGEEKQHDEHKEQEYHEKEKPATPQQEKPRRKIPSAPHKPTTRVSVLVDEPQFRSPYANEKRQLFAAGAINRYGKVVSSAGKANVRTNIDDIMESLAGTRKRAAVGAAEIKKKMDQLGIKTPQKGTGRRWIRL